MRCFLTARGGAFLAEQAPLPPATEHDAHLPRVWIDPARRFQTVEGFGGAFTEAAAVTWFKLDEARREALLRDYFDPEHGHGYTLCRVHMNSCDFALGNYAHAATPGDFALRDFSIERDRQALLPFIQAALRVAGRPVKLLASPWSPPPWMKTSGAMNGGGRLRPDCRAAWAQCYVRFIQAYAAEGVPIWAVSVQNEP
ncbi:MAG TPA: glucosylceramidase, partial [Rubrivivax sp.]|nr:glucosylceramidase [Rubrivivax sp.]